MKNYLTLFLITILLASCSQQRFTFRKKVAVNNAEKIVSKGQLQQQIDTTDAILVNTQTSYSLPLSFIAEHDKMAHEPTVIIPDDTIRKKYKFDDDQSKNDSLPDNVDNDYYAEQDADDEALKGFTYALIGFFIFPPLAVKGLIHSIRGLKSRDRMVFAILGLVLSSLATIFLALIFFIIIMLTAAGF
jgi:hypothetical protein